MFVAVCVCVFLLVFLCLSVLGFVDGFVCTLCVCFIGCVCVVVFGRVFVCVCVLCVFDYSV